MERKMSKLEKSFEKIEAKYEEKGDRKGYLKYVVKNHKLLIANIVLSFACFAINVVSALMHLTLKKPLTDFPNYIFYFCLSAVWLCASVMWSVQIPFLSKKARAAKQELKENYSKE